MAKEVKEMTIAELITEYNLLTGKSIKKFSTRAAGEKQVASARAMEGTKSMFKGGATPAALPASEGKKKEKKAAAPAPKLPGKPKQEKSPGAVSTNRSKGIGDSWNDPKIAAKRAQRNGVQVAGVQYRSVKAAFVALKLPLNGHIAFRMSLKESGKATYEHSGSKYNFLLTE